jgi:DNA-binding phage protein
MSDQSNDLDTRLAVKLQLVLPYLNERQQRLVLAAEARSLGHGGITRVARASGVSRPTIHRGLQELEAQVPQLKTRIRQPGGGRKGIEFVNPGILSALNRLVDPNTRADPESPLRWTCKSTRLLSAALKQQGYSISHQSVAELLYATGYSLQANTKVREGTLHPDRDAQFHYLNEQAEAFLKHGLPVISIDAKKKELVGEFKNPGQEWQPKQQPCKVNVHDFPDSKLGKAIPYGIYDIGKNTGWVCVGQDHDTASFAVTTLQRWWDVVGSVAYPNTKQLLISADSGGSNGYRVRLWKWELQRFADASGLEITVCHLPPGTSKWNKIEHRLFSHISMNWRGRPLVSHEVIVELIAATTTSTGLTVMAQLDTGVYPTQIKVSDGELATISITPHAFHGEWNYTIKPT